MVTRYTEIVFLDEFRMAVLPDRSGITELIVFNTLIPQGSPGNLQRLRLPRRFYGLFADIHVDRN